MTGVTWRTGVVGGRPRFVVPADAPRDPAAWAGAGTALLAVAGERAAIETFGLICLGTKLTGRYFELELRAPPGVLPELHVISGAATGRSVPLSRASCLVGRAPDCDLVVGAPYVSRHHCRILALG